MFWLRPTEGIQSSLNENSFSKCEGVGDREKRRRLQSLLTEGKFQCCFLKETKCSNSNRQFVDSIWGGSDFNWVARDSIGMFGSLIIIWNSDPMGALFTFIVVDFVCVKWKQTNNICYLVNVHSPCSFDEKRELWRDLLLFKSCFRGDAWCVAGYFNVVSRRA